MTLTISPGAASNPVEVNTRPQDYKFTGKERDPDMHVDYFGARFYEGATGRKLLARSHHGFFQSPQDSEPTGNAYADV